ncbi:MAG: hypothetical protein AAGD40_11400 [Pseudomonadota bacterium]
MNQTAIALLRRPGAAAIALFAAIGRAALFASAPGRRKRAMAV